MAVLLYEKRDGVAYLTLNRPEKRNALSPELMVRLADAWDDVESDPTVRVAVLAGAGELAFCAGGDLGRLLPLRTNSRSTEDEWDQRIVDDPSIWDRAMLRRPDFYKPVVAAINGPAYAGGVDLVVATDIRIASPTAQFAVTEVRRGMVAAGGSLTRLTGQVGWSAAMELLLTGEPIDAHRAKEIGLVNRIVPQSEVTAEAGRVAQAIALGAPIALTKTKEAAARTLGRPLEEGFAIELECADFVSATEDAVEGPLAFMERRAPVFLGK
ncbi:enoyl-CoA hydratase/isomerase family protein [Rhodococcus koreensis]